MSIRFFTLVDKKMVGVILLLMFIGFVVVLFTTQPDPLDFVLTPTALRQLQWYILGWGGFLFFVALDYQKLRGWAPWLYLLILGLLLGLFFVPAIQNVHRWYKIPFLGGREFQPSEYAKIILIIFLSSWLEKHQRQLDRPKIALSTLFLSFLPLMLILRQPDLGTSLLLYPIILVMLYFAGFKKRILYWMCIVGIGGIVASVSIFTGFISHEQMKPLATTFIKEYQYERLNPHTYHQEAAQNAIALGGMEGAGWKGGDFARRSWLPAAHTDSVFPAFAEAFGLIGIFSLLALFLYLIYLSFKVSTVAKDPFGCFLAAGIATYLAVQVIVNIGMMSGCLPITGVPLILMTYGGSSVLMSMSALGILQSIYTRRYLF